MSTQKKRKQKSLHDLLSYMQMLEDGISFSHIHKNYGINEARLKVLWSRYQKEGISGLQKQLNINADYALKHKIVLDIEENHLTFARGLAKVWCKSSKNRRMVKKSCERRALMH